MGTEDDFGAAVEAALDVGVDALIVVAAAAKVNDLDEGLVGLNEQNVFRLQVAVHDAMLLQERQGLQNLQRKPDCESVRL
jgi:hypothetical protein